MEPWWQGGPPKNEFHNWELMFDCRILRKNSRLVLIGLCNAPSVTLLKMKLTQIAGWLVCLVLKFVLNNFDILGADSF